jgi:hypothetical protein
MATYRRVAPKARVVVAPDLISLNKSDLVALADKRGVDSSGTKADLVARLGKP